MKKKLHLNKEVIAHLSDLEANKVKGGTGSIWVECEIDTRTHNALCPPSNLCPPYPSTETECSACAIKYCTPYGGY